MQLALRRHEMCTLKRSLCHNARGDSQDENGAYVRPFERPDGVELYLREFLLHPGVTARGAAVLVHGMTVYSAVLQPLIDHLVQSGASLPHSAKAASAFAE